MTNEFRYRDGRYIAAPRPTAFVPLAIALFTLAALVAWKAFVK